MAELLGLGRMARRVGVSRAWLKLEAERGRIPHVKTRNRFLFNPCAVIEVLAARAANPAARGQQDPVCEEAGR